jgi:hypothetical protein
MGKFTLLQEKQSKKSLKKSFFDIDLFEEESNFQGAS